MTILYYATSERNHRRGEYACNVSRPVADMAMERDPGKYCLFEETYLGCNSWFDTDYTKDHYVDDFDQDFLKVGGTV